MPTKGKKNVKAAHPKSFHCPFACGSVYSREYDLKKHLITVQSQNGDEKHLISDRIWAAQDLSIALRPKNLTDLERKRRHQRSAKKYREEHADEIKEREKQSREERKSVFKLLKRVAKIALNERGRRFYVTTEAEFDIFKTLYEGTQMVGAVLDPATLLNPTLPATIDTFPYFVTIYLRPNKWPKVITNQVALGLPPTLLIKQIPGDEEYRALSLLFHPDRTRPRESSVSDGDTFKVKPNAAMDTLLNAGYDLWKETVRSRLLAEEPYDSLTADDNEFAKRSQSHANALELFGCWFRISCSASNAMVPGNRSMAEMHHFVNTIPEREEEEPEVESSDNNDDEEWARMTDIGIIYHAVNLAEKKPGRPRRVDKRVESEESEEIEEIEEE